MPDSHDGAILDAEDSRWLERTRSWVLNILVLDGLSILASALLVRWWGPVEADVDPATLKKGFFGSLFACFVLARILLRQLGSRERLAPGSSRGRRYLQSRVVTAALGWAALPLGLGYALTVEPTVQGIVPYWVAALLLGAIALPRQSDLEGFDEPIPRDSEATP